MNNYFDEIFDSMMMGFGKPVNVRFNTAKTKERKSIKRLAKSVREYKLPSFLSALFVSLEVVMEVLIPFEMADMLDYGINAGNMDFVLQSGIRLVIYACLVILFGNLAGGIVGAYLLVHALQRRDDVLCKGNLEILIGAAAYLLACANDGGITYTAFSRQLGY